MRRESPDRSFGAHWDHEPTPDPSQEGNASGADECLLTSWEESGVGRLMESKAGRRRWRPYLIAFER